MNKDRERKTTGEPNKDKNIEERTNIFFVFRNLKMMYN
jgi:hypothetical protein